MKEMTISEDVLSSSQHDGILHVARSVVCYCRDKARVWNDRSFDRRYGTRTFSRGSLKHKQIDLLGPHGDENQGHQPIQVGVFRRMMKDFRQLEEPSHFVFLDLGSGRGRAVLMAAESRFKRCIGVEFSKAMHSLAENNLQAFCSKIEESPPVEFHLLDVSDFSLPTEDTVCFLYNPFGPRVMEKVLANVKASLQAHPRSFYLIYRNPVLAAQIESGDLFAPVIRRQSYIVYRARHSS